MKMIYIFCVSKCYISAFVNFLLKKMRRKRKSIYISIKNIYIYKYMNVMKTKNN